MSNLIHSFARRLALPALCGGAVLLGGGPARAGFVSSTWETVANTSNPGGGALTSQAVFTASGNQLSIKLTNLTPNPKSIGASLSRLVFTLTTGTTTGTFVSGAGDSITIASGGTVTDNGPVSGGKSVVHWDFQGGTGGNFTLTRIGSGIGEPDFTIIGPPNSTGKYSNANASIAGSGSHNPFFSQTATFVLNIPALGGATDFKVSGMSFLYGSEAETSVRGVETAAIPEPSSLVMAGLASLAGIAGGFRARRRRAA